MLPVVSGSAVVREAYQGLTEVAKGLGYERVHVCRAARDDAPHGLLLAGRMPEGWPEAYRDAGLRRHDAILDRLLSGPVHFTFEELDAELPASAGYSRLRALMVRFGMLDGFAASFGGPGTSPETFAVFTSARKIRLNHCDKQTLSAVGEYVAKVALSALPAPVPDRGRLSDREASILAWVASGMTSDEIAGRENLAVHTVNSYVKIACEKLGAANRIHAVALAMRRGILQGAA